MNGDARPDTTGLREAVEAALEQIERQSRTCKFDHTSGLRDILAAHPDPTPEPDATRTDSNGERSSSGEPDAGDVEALAKVIEAHEPQQNADATTYYRAFATRILTSDWLANQRTAAREQGRAEGEGAGYEEGFTDSERSCEHVAEWVAAVERFLVWLERHKEHENPLSVLEKWDVPTADQQGYLAGLSAAAARLRALLTADHTKALDAVKALAAREALLAVADEIDSGPTFSLPPSVFSALIRECADQIGGPS